MIPARRLADDLVTSTDHVSAVPLPSREEEALGAPWRWLRHASRGDGHVRQQSLALLEDLASAEQRVRSEYIGRYPVELLQNAHDACDDAGQPGRVWMEITDSALVVGNEGAPFDQSRICALTRLGSGTKGDGRDQRHLIGYKGIGFSSVFAVSDRPQVLRAHGADFGFDEGRARQAVTEALSITPTFVPARKFPFEVQPEDWAEDASTVARMFDDGAVTVIRLPFRDAVTAGRVEADLNAILAPQSLLFLPRVRDLHIRTRGSTDTWRRVEGPRAGAGRITRLSTSTGGEEQWLVAEARVPAPAEAVRQLRDPLWANVRKLHVAVAIPWRNDSVPFGTKAQPVHVYFPTDDRTGRAVLVHGDFYVDSARRHIEQVGPGGRISDTVAEAAADLLARLAASVATPNSGVLDCLAVAELSTGYGSRLNELIGQRLRQEHFVPTADGGPAQRPDHVRCVAVGHQARSGAAMTQVLHPKADLVAEGATGGRAGLLLRELAVSPLTPQDLAQRISLEGSALTYPEALQILYTWTASLPSAQAGQVHTTLRRRPILQDSQGQWREPREVALPGPDLPALPPVLRRGIVQLPHDATPMLRHWVTTQLKVPALTAATVLEDLLAAIRENQYGHTLEEKRQVLRLLRRLWDLDRKALQARQQPLGVVEVPVRAAGGEVVSWRPARTVYFPSAWTRNGLLEDLYGHLGHEEFLAVSAPRKAAALDRARAFYRTLGVADAPRSTTVVLRGQPGRALTPDSSEYEGWRADPKVREAEQCPKGHPQVARRYEFPVLDRLGLLLHSPTLRSMTALAETLSRPGSRASDAEVACTASGHTARSSTLKCVGYQSWLLEKSAWVPVQGDPLERSFVQPGRAWRDLPTDMRAATVPRASLRDGLGQRLGLVRGTKPHRTQIERALTDLAEAYPVLADAPDPAVKTAAWLCRQLEKAPESEAGPTPPPLPATRAGVPTWDPAPLHADLPHLDVLTTVAVLPRGEWRGLRAAYALASASDRVQCTALPRGRREHAPFLDARLKAQLVAFLARRDELQKSARRVARLQEVAVEELVLRYRIGTEQQLTPALNQYLDLHRDEHGEVVEACLYLTADASENLYAVCVALETFLGHDRHRLMSLVSAPVDVLAEDGIGEDEVAAAADAISREQLPSSSQPDEEAGPAPVHVDTVRGSRPSGPLTGTPTEPFPPSGEEPTPEVVEASHAGGDTPRSSGAHLGSSREPGGRRAAAGGQPTEDREVTVPALPERLQFHPRPTPRPRPAAGGSGTGPPQSHWSGNAVGGPGASLVDRDEVEKRAVEATVAFFWARPDTTAVNDVQTQNLGWDLQVLSATEDLLVEVKGAAGSPSAFILTRNELAAAEVHGANYLISYVTDLASPRPRLTLLRNPSRLADGDMTPISWSIRNWTDLADGTWEIEDLPRSAGA